MRIKIPFCAVIIIGLSLILLSVMLPRGGPVERYAKPDIQKISDSISKRMAIDSMALVRWAEEVWASRGDSLRAAFAKKARQDRIRIQNLLSSRETTNVRDTVCLAGEDVRTVLIHDSSMVVSGDSLRGELRVCSAMLDEAMKRPESCPGGWWGTTLAAGSGFLAGYAACRLL